MHTGPSGGTQEIEETIRIEVHRQGAMLEAASGRKRDSGTQVT
jgi:hypothetical protein